MRSGRVSRAARNLSSGSWLCICSRGPSTVRFPDETLNRARGVSEGRRLPRDRRQHPAAEQVAAEGLDLLLEALLEGGALGFREEGLLQGGEREAGQLGRAVAEGLVQAQILAGEGDGEEGRIVGIDRDAAAGA